MWADRMSEHFLSLAVNTLSSDHHTNITYILPVFLKFVISRNTLEICQHSGFQAVLLGQPQPTTDRFGSCYHEAAICLWEIASFNTAVSRFQGSPMNLIIVVDDSPTLAAEL